MKSRRTEAISNHDSIRLSRRDYGRYKDSIYAEADVVSGV